MKTLAESVKKSMLELDALSDSGGISEDVEKRLLAVIESSRTGRLFGHKSAVDLPKHLLETIATCNNLVEENEISLAEISDAFSEEFSKKRGRRPTVINQALLDVKNSLQKRNAVVITSEPPKLVNKSRIQKFFRAIGRR